MELWLGIFFLGFERRAAVAAAVWVGLETSSGLCTRPSSSSEVLLTEMRISEELCYKNLRTFFSMMANLRGKIACKWRLHLSVCSLGKFELEMNGKVER